MTGHGKKSKAVCSFIALALTVCVLDCFLAPAKGQTELDVFKPMHAFIYKNTDDFLANKTFHYEKLALKKNSGENEISEKTRKVKWRSWSDAIFEEAKKENKFVLLDLEAVWCHWCHVMEEKTYSNPDVINLIEKKFIPVKVDQDSRPDLSHKYEDYGWPATIIFNSDGVEIVKRSGYIRPERMIRLLNAIIKDPSLEEEAPKKVSFSRKGTLSDELRKELHDRHVKGYDTKNGAWGRFHKFLDWDSVEYAMQTGLDGDKASKERARKTLIGQLNLLDPVWGGVYQYSTDGDWGHPHFEKIMQMQSENMRIYAIGYILYGDSKFLDAAKSIAGYLDDFLSSSKGAFYTSQDADLKPGKHSAGYFDLSNEERRKLGIPRIDKHIYSRENGWAINGLAYLYMASGDRSYLDRAIKASNWIEANRMLNGGGFKHDAQDKAGPYLGDSLAMGRAYLSLYVVTADKKWLKKAEGVAKFISGKFKSENGAGFSTAVSRSKVAPPEPLTEENVRLARFTNSLFHYTGEKLYKEMADQAMRYLATPQIAKRRKILVAGPLLADRELSRDPVHVTIVGSKKDPKAKLLFKAALKAPCVYRRIEWYDRTEGKLPNMQVDYPELKKAAAFSCGDGICSSPKYEPDKVIELFDGKKM